MGGQAEYLHLVSPEQLHGLLQLQVPQTTESVRTGGQQLDRDRVEENLFYLEQINKIVPGLKLSKGREGKQDSYKIW